MALGILLLSKLYFIQDIVPSVEAKIIDSKNEKYQIENGRKSQDIFKISVFSNRTMAYWEQNVNTLV